MKINKITAIVLVGCLLSTTAARCQDTSGSALSPKPAVADQRSKMLESEKSKTLATLESVSLVSTRRGIAIEILTDRPITPDSATLTNPDRLVLDFPNTISASAHNRISVHRNDLESVRIGVQPVDPPVTRVVLDLRQPRSYQLAAHGRRLIVTLRPPETAVEKVPAAVESGRFQAEDKQGEVSGRPVLGSASPEAEGAPEKQPTGNQTANTPLVEVPKRTPAGEEESLTVQPTAPIDPGQVTANTSAMPGTSKPAPDPSPLRTGVYTGSNDDGSASAPSNETLDYDGITSEPLSNRPHQFDLISSLIAAVPLPPLSSAPSNNAVAGLTLNLAKMTSVDLRQPFRVVQGTNQPRTQEYVIGEQDVLTITVWKEKELSETVTVRPDGKITIPLLNEIKVAGLTPTELRSLLTEKFKPFVVAPEVTIAIREIHSRHVYLVGEVGRTGAFSLNNATTTVLQLIAEAGGLKDFAKRKRIYIVRHQGGKEARFTFNYDEVIKGRNAQQNIILKPGDMVVVP